MAVLRGHTHWCLSTRPLLVHCSTRRRFGHEKPSLIRNTDTHCRCGHDRPSLIQAGALPRVLPRRATVPRHVPGSPCPHVGTVKKWTRAAIQVPTVKKWTRAAIQVPDRVSIPGSHVSPCRLRKLSASVGPCTDPRSLHHKGAAAQALCLGRAVYGSEKPASQGSGCAGSPPRHTHASLF